jgi:hypothetical protein
MGSQTSADGTMAAGALIIATVLGALCESWAVFLIILVVAGVLAFQDQSSRPASHCGGRCRPARRRWRR